MRVVLDTNVIVSALIFGGKPKRILELVIDQSVEAVASPFLLSECLDILSKKFHLGEADLILFERMVRKRFIMVYPRRIVRVISDAPDNHILEAAIEGKADYIVSGDKHILQIKEFRGIQVLRPADFLKKTSKI